MVKVGRSLPPLMMKPPGDQGSSDRVDIMDITPEFFIMLAGLGVFIILLILVPVVVLLIQRRRKARNSKTSLPQGSDSSDFSQFLREKYQEENFRKQVSDDELQ